MHKAELRQYFERDLGWGTGYQQEVVFDFLCQAAEEGSGGVVLDAGAGHQRYKPFFAQSLYLAHEHPVAGAVNKGIREFDILCDARTIPLRSECIDVILSTSSLEPMRYPEAFFHEAHRVLRPGGGLHINVPFVYLEHEVPFDFQRPTRYGLARWYEDVGFERVRVRPTSSSVYTAVFFLREALSEIATPPTASRWRRLRPTLIRRMAHLLLLRISREFDTGPSAVTKLPVGWVATGYKCGTAPGVNRQWTDAAGFLKEHAIEGARFVDGGLHFSA